MKTYAVANQKGGTGKTTTTVNLAAALGALHQRVLVVDLDPQANSSDWLGVKASGERLLDVLRTGRGLKAIIHTRETNADVGQGTTADQGLGVHLAPSGHHLIVAERELHERPGAEVTLRAALLQVRKLYDWCILDCPPNVGVLTASALTAADRVLVPVDSGTMSLKGLGELWDFVQIVIERLNPDLLWGPVLCNRVDRRNGLSIEIEQKARQKFDGLVFEPTIRETVALRYAASAREPITDYEPDSPAARDFMEAAAWLCQLEGVNVARAQA